MSKRDQKFIARLSAARGVIVKVKGSARLNCAYPGGDQRKRPMAYLSTDQLLRYIDAGQIKEFGERYYPV